MLSRAGGQKQGSVAAGGAVPMKGENGMNDSETSGTPPGAVAAAGRSLREIAVELYGREQVEACWHSDSWMRSKLRRRLCRARLKPGGGTDVDREADAGPDHP